MANLRIVAQKYPCRGQSALWQPSEQYGASQHRLHVCVVRAPHTMHSGSSTQARVSDMI